MCTVCCVSIFLLFHVLLYSEEDCSQSSSVDVDDSNRKRKKIASEEKAKIIVGKVFAC